MHGDATPAPIRVDHGRVRQVIVQYTGPRRGGVGYRGPSGRLYRYDATPNGTHCYVLDEDAKWFKGRVDFEVLEDTWIDPELDQLADQAAELQEFRAMFEASMTSLRVLVEDATIEARSTPDPAPPTSRRRAGRPRIAAYELEQCWHLKHHCLPAWTTQQLAERFVPEDRRDPAGAMRRRLFRFSKSRRGLEHCVFCDVRDCPDPPEQDSPVTW